MFNLLSAELFKLRKSLSFYITLLITIGLATFFGFIYAFMYDQIQAEMGNLDTGGMTIAMPSNGGEMLLNALPMNLGTVMLLVAIFSAILISGEFDSGCVRNPLSVGLSRMQFYLTKFIVLLIVSLLFTIITVAASTLIFTAILDWGTTPDLGLFASSFGTSFLILIAQVALFSLIAFLTRKLGATIGIIMGYWVLDQLISVVLMYIKSDFLISLTRIFPTAGGAKVTEVIYGTSSQSDLWYIAILSIGLIIAYSVVSIITLQKRDI